MSVYLDHNACTPADPRVLDRYLDWERNHAANPGSLHQSGRAARALLEDSREQIAAALRVPKDAIVFVSGGTEANNTIIRGAGNPALPVLLGEVEHASTIDAAGSRGVVLWDVDAEGAVEVQDPGTPVGLIALTHGQNEVGTIQPVEAAGDLARRLGVPFHLDASQTLGRVPLQAAIQVADTVALSTHKAGGIRGMGVLVVRNASALTQPLLSGGGQERGLRAGTPNPALAAATAWCVELAVEETAERAQQMRAARDTVWDALRSTGCQRIGSADGLPNTLMVCFPGIEGRILLPALDIAGIEVSQGSACSSGSPLPPRVLMAMGLDEATARCCLRISVGYREDLAEIRAASARLKDVVLRLRSVD